MRVPRLALLTSLLLAAPACGGGGGSLPGSSYDIDPRAQSTGVVSASASGSSAPTVLINDAGWQLSAGDGGTDVVEHAFVEFDIWPYASTGTFHRAILRMHLRGVLGSPTSSLGPLRVDAINMGGILDTGDYLNAIVLQAAIGDLIASPSLGWHTIDVTTAVRTAHDLGLPRIGFRLYFPVLNDGNGNLDRLVFSNVGTPESPELDVRFEGSVGP